MHKSKRMEEGGRENHPSSLKELVGEEKLKRSQRFSLGLA
jgi:hypothetical protein